MRKITILQAISMCATLRSEIEDLTEELMDQSGPVIKDGKPIAGDREAMRTSQIIHSIHENMVKLGQLKAAIDYHNINNTIEGYPISFWLSTNKLRRNVQNRYRQLMSYSNTRPGLKNVDNGVVIDYDWYDAEAIHKLIDSYSSDAERISNEIDRLNSIHTIEVDW